MDNNKIIKDFINYICDVVEYNLRVKKHDGLKYTLTNDRMSYLIADKGIEKRIQKTLLKKYNFRSVVIFEERQSCNKYLDGELTVKVLKKFR